MSKSKVACFSYKTEFLRFLNNLYNNVIIGQIYQLSTNLHNEIFYRMDILTHYLQILYFSLFHFIQQLCFRGIILQKSDRNNHNTGTLKTCGIQRAYIGCIYLTLLIEFISVSSDVVRKFKMQHRQITFYEPIDT